MKFLYGPMMSSQTSPGFSHFLTVREESLSILSFRDEYVLSEYRKRDAVEKLFMSSKTFTGGGPLMVHGMDVLRGEMFVNLIAIAIRSRILAYMRSSGLLKKYSVEKMLLELHKLSKVILQDGKEITTEITRKQKEILESIGIKPEHLPTFLKS